LKKPEDWSKYGYSKKDSVWFRSVDHIERVHENSLSPEEFVRRFERAQRPVMLQGITERWSASKNWTVKNLCRDYGNIKFQCGDDDKGKSMKMKMKHFVSYMQNQTDDSPLYVFDSTFDERNGTKKLRSDYEVPKYFKQNLWDFMPKDKDPPHSWFLIGPKRSGTTVHIDPLGTSAWNTLLQGRKRWFVIEPKAPKKIVEGIEFVKSCDDDEAIMYFTNTVPMIRHKYKTNFEMFEFIQHPGETIFIPGGWWHAVLNLDDTIAVTHNYVNEVNFDVVWRKTRKGRLDVSREWLRRIGVKYPHLVDRAKCLDKEDDFDFEREIERKRLKKLRKKEMRQKRKRSMSTETTKEGASRSKIL
jgi:histone arginine demethylase JMJD6